LNDKILSKVIGTEFESHIQFEGDKPWLRYDTDDCGPKEQWDVYCGVAESLKQIGLELVEPLVEHDCISGYLKLIEVESVVEVETVIRPSWDEYFIGIAHEVAKRSTCLRRSVGCVVVIDKRMVCTGYNGAPAGIKHCAERGGCMREKLNVPSGERHELCYAAHAEQNALCQASKYGIALEGSTFYITNSPCSLCAKLLINIGVVKIIYADGYPDDLAIQLIEEAEIPLIKFEKKI